VATITLTGATAYSAIVGLVDGDTIDCAGFALTLDIQPTHLNIAVVSPGTAGTVVISGAWTIPTWDFTAGTATMIGTVPSGATLGAVTGGSGSNTFGVGTNNGTISGDVTGGSGSGCHGVSANNGTISGDVTGGSGSGSHGVSTNNGTISGDVQSGPGNNRSGVSTNNGTISGNVIGSVTTGSTTAVSINNGLIAGNIIGGTLSTAIALSNNNGTVSGNVTGGSATNAAGININNGVVTGLVTGGSGTNGIINHSGVAIGGLVNGTQNAIGTWRGTTTLVHGPLTQVTIPATITTLYSLFGPLHASAVVGPSTTVTVLQAGGSTRPSNPFLQQVIG